MDLAAQVNNMNLKGFQQALENALTIMNEVKKQLVQAGYRDVKMTLDVETSFNHLGEIQTFSQAFEFNCYIYGLSEWYAVEFKKFLSLNQKTYNLLVDEITDYFMDEYCYK